MVTNDATILKLKHDVLYEVAKLAWEDQLVDDKRDELPGKNDSRTAGPLPLLYL